MLLFILSFHLTLFYKQTFISLFATSILVNLNSLGGDAGEVPVHAMKTYTDSVGVKVYLHTLLTLALDGGEQSTSCPSHFTSRKEPRYLLNRRLSGPEAVCMVLEKTKSLAPTMI
jgi:hypothetical protein